MNDAYTIGITLALENGVSEGLSTIRRDLQLADVALGHMTTGLAGLRPATDTAMSGARLDLAWLNAEGRRVLSRLPSAAVPALGARKPASKREQPDAAIAAQVNPSAPTTPATIVLPMSATRRADPNASVRAAPLPPNAVSTPVLRPQPTAKTVDLSAMGPSRAAAPVPEQIVRPVSAPARPAPTAITTPLRVPPVAPVMTASAVAPVLPAMTASAAAPVPPLTAPVVAPSARVSVVRAISPAAPMSSAPEFSTKPKRVTVAADPLEPFRRDLDPADLAALGRAMMRDRAHSPFVPVPQLSGIAEWQTPERNPAVKADTVAAFNRDEQRAPASWTPGRWTKTALFGPANGPRAPLGARHNTEFSAPAQLDAGQGANSVPPSFASQLSSGVATGNVYLDGHEVGHWIIEHLAREAGRPPSATTGFDPKLSAIWPGAPIVP